MNDDSSRTDPFASALDTAIEQEKRVTSLLLEKIAEQARTDAAFRQRLAKEPERTVREVAAQLPGAQGKAIGDKQVAEVTELVRIGTSSVLPEIDVQEVQRLVFDTIEDARHSFKLSLLLTQVLFYAGLTMVAVSFIVMVLYQTEQVPSLILGGVGVSSVITSLVLNPLDRVQNAAGNLVQLEIAFLSYYKLLYLFNRPPGELDVKDAIKVSNEIRAMFQDVVAAIERFCEYRGDGSSSVTADQPEP